MRYLTYLLLTLLYSKQVSAVSEHATNEMPHQDRVSRNRPDNNNLHPITTGNIHHAVKEWMRNRENTKARFGHIRDWDTSQVTDMSQLFSWERDQSLSQFRDNITAWDTHRVTNLSHTFYGNAAMNLDLGQWNTSSVVDMSACFANTKHYAGHGLGTWDFSNVVNASHMFHQAVAFESNAVHKWDVRSLVDATRMFKGASSYTGDHRWKWNSGDLQYMTEMFAQATSFVGDLSEMNVSSVKDMKGAFFKALEFNGYLGDWETGNVQDMNSMFAYAENFEGQGLDSWNVAQVTNMANMLKLSLFNQDLNSWQVHAVTDMRSMFRYTASMEQEVCWTLHNHANVDGIFFQSNAHFDRSCVKGKYVVQSCCQPAIDNKCDCSETTMKEDYEIEAIDNYNNNGEQKSGATNNSITNKTQYLMAMGVASIAVFTFLLAVAIRRKFRIRKGITTIDFDCGGADDSLDISDLDIPNGSACVPYPGDELLTIPTTSTSRSEDEDGDHERMEDIPVRELI